MGCVCPYLAYHRTTHRGPLRLCRSALLQRCEELAYLVKIFPSLGIGGISGGARLADGKRLAIRRERFSVVVGHLREDCTNLLVADGEVALGLAIARVRLDPGLGQGQTLAVAGEGTGGLAALGQHVANVVVADDEVALGLAIVRVSQGPGLGQDQILAVASEGPSGVAALGQHVADLVVANREVALGLAIARVGLGQGLG